MSDPDQNIPFKKSHKYWFYNENTIEIRTRKGLLSMVFYGISLQNRCTPHFFQNRAGYFVFG